MISIIMPAYNAGRFIAAAIQSVLAQTYSHWELWVIDDASEDDTALIMDRFQDARIHYLPVSRIGSPSGVRNVGLQKASGEFIAFLDADDLYFPDTLKTLLTPLLSNPQLTAVYGFCRHIDEFSKPLPERDMNLQNGYQLTWEKIVKGHISSQLPALMLRRSTFERVGFFNADLCGPEDYEYYARLFLDNLNAVCCLPQFVYEYRVHLESLTKAPKHYAGILKDCIKILEWLYTHPDLPAEARPFKSQAYTEVYRYLARERLLINQPRVTREIARAAWEDKNIEKPDWLKVFIPLIGRSFLSPGLNQWLRNIRTQLYKS